MTFWTKGGSGISHSEKPHVRGRLPSILCDRAAGGKGGRANPSRLSDSPRP